MISISCKLRTTIAVTALMALFACAGCRKARTDPFPGSGVVAGWQKTSDTHAYAAKDLWQYIDGEAEQYISAGVVSASTSDYKYQDGLEAVVDVYTMGDAAGAAKMFNASPEKRGKTVQLGDGGIAYEQSVSFRKGTFLVHVVGYQSTPGVPQALLALARGVEAKL